MSTVRTWVTQTVDGKWEVHVEVPGGARLLGTSERREYAEAIARLWEEVNA